MTDRVFIVRAKQNVLHLLQAFCVEEQLNKAFKEIGHTFTVKEFVPDPNLKPMGYWKGGGSGDDHFVEQDH